MDRPIGSGEREERLFIDALRAIAADTDLLSKLAAVAWAIKPEQRIKEEIWLALRATGADAGLEVRREDLRIGPMGVEVKVLYGGQLARPATAYSSLAWNLDIDRANAVSSPKETTHLLAVAIAVPAGHAKYATVA